MYFSNRGWLLKQNKTKKQNDMPENLQYSETSVSLAREDFRLC